MTKNGYRTLLGLLVVVAALGAIAARPSALELGVAPTMSCSDWPDDYGPVRLTNCTADARMFARSIHGGVEIGLRGASGMERWQTDDPEWIALVERIPQESGAERRERYLERHAAELVRTGLTLEGTARQEWMSEDPAHPTLDAMPQHSIGRPLAIVITVIALLAMLGLVRAQRRWERRRMQLAGAAQPATF